MSPLRIPAFFLFLASAPLAIAADPVNPAAANTAVSAETLRARAEAAASAAKWVKLGDGLMQKTRDTLKHDYAAPEAAYKKALSEDPTCTPAMVGMAWVRNSEHKFEEGSEWAEKALAIDPRQEDAHALLGDHAVELGVYDEAYDHYQAALDISPDLSSLCRAGHLLYLTGDSNQAQFLLEKAIASGGPFPENLAWAHSELALVQFNSGAIFPAAVQAAKAVAQAPENPRALEVMGRIAAARGQTDKAIGFYEKSISIMPGHNALAALYDLLTLKGDAAAAEDMLTRITAYHNPNDPLNLTGPHAHGNERSSADFSHFMADHDMRLEEATKRAEEVYKTFHNIKVEDALAWCYYKQGDLKKARRMIVRAMRMKTKDASIFYHAGMIYRKMGSESAAREMLLKAVNLNPNFDPIQGPLAAAALREMSSRPAAAGSRPAEPAPAAAVD